MRRTDLFRQSPYRFEPQNTVKQIDGQLVVEGRREADTPGRDPPKLPRHGPDWPQSRDCPLVGTLQPVLTLHWSGFPSASVSIRGTSAAARNWDKARGPYGTARWPC